MAHACWLQVVFQFQFHPNSNPDNHSSYLQRISPDDGLSWPGGTRDITDQLDGCNPHRPVGMMVESGGSKYRAAPAACYLLGTRCCPISLELEAAACGSPMTTV
jgi:hypothetical protein